MPAQPDQPYDFAPGNAQRLRDVYARKLAAQPVTVSLSLGAYAHAVDRLAELWSRKHDRNDLSFWLDWLITERKCDCDACYYARNN